MDASSTLAARSIFMKIKTSTFKAPHPGFGIQFDKEEHLADYPIDDDPVLWCTEYSFFINFWKTVYKVVLYGSLRQEQRQDTAAD